jgi:hypothetical protein
MNVTRAAKILCIAPETVRRLIRSGILRAEKRGRAHALDVQLSDDHRLTVRALADCMHCSPRWVRYLIQRQALRSERIGRAHRISVAEGIKLMQIRLKNS